MEFRDKPSCNISHSISMIAPEVSSRIFSNLINLNKALQALKLVHNFQMTQHVFKFLKWKELLNIRVVGRNWNELACERLRHFHSKKRVIINSELEMETFLATMETRIQDPIPFSSYRFGPADPRTFQVLRPFLSNFGIWVTACLQIKEPPVVPLAHILGEVPNLEQLRISGLEVKLNWILFPVAPISKLKSFTLLRTCVCDSETHGELSTNIITTWIGQQPNLRHFECGAKLKVTDATAFIEFLHSQYALRLLTLDVKFQDGIPAPSTMVLRKIPPLNLFVLNTYELNGGIISGWLDKLSKNLKMVQLDIRMGGINLSYPLPNLEELFLTFTSFGEVEGNFDSIGLPALKYINLLLTDECVAGTRRYFRNTAFPTVEKLTLYRPNDLMGIGFESWHSIFPNVQVLRVQGNMDKEILTSIVSDFPLIRKLHIKSYNPEPNLAFIFFNEEPIVTPHVKNQLWDLKFKEKEQWILAGLKGKVCK